MKPTHRSSSVQPDDIGGAIAPRLQPDADSAADFAGAADSLVDSLYAQQPGFSASSRRVRSLKRQQQAKAIAEDRLTQIGEDLLGLADDLRSLHPHLSDSLDDAWSDVEQALELLLDEAAW
ncbi:MAG: hypothetical protein Fur0046_01490 [Cyanobacteria bacterium J069]|nr:MAG: hypothetical protein D6742_13025 [Cyanobacteria bacterium J069]